MDRCLVQLDTEITEQQRLLLSQIVEEVNDSIRVELGRELDEAERTVYRDGNGTCFLPLADGPIVEVANLWLVTSVDEDGEQLELIEPYEYAVRGTRDVGHLGPGWIELRGRTFPCGKQNVKVEYTAGFASAPLRLRRGATNEVLADYLNRSNAGLASEKVGEATLQMLSPNQRQQAVRRLVAPYR